LRKTLFYISAFFILTLVCLSAFSVFGQSGNTPGWKAGVARVVITPEQSMWMAGYAAREHPSEGKLHDLWIKALALEDSGGKRGVLLTADLLGFPKKMSDRIRDRVEKKYGLTRSQVVLSCSHTHSGPVLNDALFDIYPLDKEQLERVEKYSAWLEDQVVSLVGKALSSMAPALLFARNGVTRFEVNRRNNIESEMPTQTELKGPSDYAVPVIKVANEKGEVVAIVFGYACHATVLDQYMWSGDYPGYSQIELEKSFPGATAMFFQGAGSDQNPLPRRTVPLAVQYGKELAAAVERILNEDMPKLNSSLSVAYAEVSLPLNNPPTEQELVKMTNEFTSFQKRWAERMLDETRRGVKFISSYPYPVQVWKLGDQPLFVLGGELAVEYAIELKRLFGTEIFVMGYSNDVMAYIPSETILGEGGYEGEVSQRVYGLPSLWKPGIEKLILDQAAGLAEKAGVAKMIKK
jgi:hypothetical protein